MLNHFGRAVNRRRSSVGFGANDDPMGKLNPLVFP
jgi:hypothetical protein